MAVAGAKRERLVALKDVPRVSMLDSGSTWNGVAPDGSPLIMRDAGSQQLYSLELRLPWQCAYPADGNPEACVSICWPNRLPAEVILFAIHRRPRDYAGRRPKNDNPEGTGLPTNWPEL